MSGYSSGRNTKMAKNALKGFFTVLFQPEKEKQKTAEAVENTAFPAVLSLVGMTGFEPAAFASRTQRSTKLSHIPLSV